MPDLPPSPDPAFRVLVVVSRPLDQKELPSIADQWALINGLAAVKAPVEIKVLRPPTIEGLRTEVLSSYYDVLHFDGHGAFAIACPNCRALNAPDSRKCGREKCDASLEDEKPRGYLAFEQEDGTGDALAADELAEMLQAVPGLPTKLVILSACESAKGGDDSLADSLTKSGVPCVLGMNVSVPVTLTIALSKQFYSGLGAGMTIFNAFKSGISAISRLPDVELKEADSKDVEWIKAREVPKLSGDGSMKLTRPNTHGSLILEKMKLFGVPDYDFVGEFIPGNPSRGRKGLLFQIIKALNDGEKLVVLTGQGGIGKSVLAAVAARRISWRYPGGVFWRSAEDSRRLDLIELLNSFTNVFGEEFRKLSLDTKKDQILSYMRNLDAPSLIVVDSAEMIEDKEIWSFLQSIPMPSAALVTIRDSISLPAAEIHIREMDDHEAITLFFSEAGKRSPLWSQYLTEMKDKKVSELLSKEDLAALEHILKLVQGHPKTISVAAAAVPSGSLLSLLRSLQDHPPKDVTDRFDFSYLKLQTDRQRMLPQRMAAFGASVKAEAVMAVCSQSDEAVRCSDDLRELVRKSLVEYEEDSMRYRLHPLMRQYAEAKAGETIMSEFRKRAAAYFLGYAAKFCKDFDILETDRDNILAGMDLAAALQKSDEVETQRTASRWTIAFTGSMGSYLGIRGYWDELRLRLQQAIEAARIVGEVSVMAGCINDLGIQNQKIGNYDEARRLYQESLKIEQELGDKRGISRSLHALGILAQDTSDYDEAHRLYQESLKIKQELGDKSSVSMTLHQLGTLAQDTGDYDEARRLYQESLKIEQELGDKSNASRSLHQLGMLANAQGDHVAARRFCEDSLKIKEDMGDKVGSGLTNWGIGNIAFDQGDYKDALYKWQESLIIFRQLGDKKNEAGVLHQLGMLFQATGDYAEAQRLYRESLKIGQELGDKSGNAYSLAQLALLEEDQGNIKAAIKLIVQAGSIFSEIGANHLAEKVLIQKERLERMK